MRKTLVIFMGFVMVLSLLLGACGGKETTPATTASQSKTTPATAVPTTTQPQYGGVMKVLTSVGPRNLGKPGGATLPSDGSLMRPAVEALFGLDESGSEKPVPQLATDWKYNADYTTLTLTLRKGVKFHDGTGFNAEAAKICLDMGIEGKRAELVTIGSVDIVDDYTIRLNLKSYDPTLLGQMVGVPTMMVSPTSLKKLGDEATFHPVGTGPFKFVSYERDILLKYERFDDYWQQGKPYLDGIEFVIVADAMTRLASFKAGEAQIGGAEPKDASELIASGKYDSSISYGNLMGLCGDGAHSSSTFSDVKVRRAIAYSIDAKSIADALGYGIYAVSNQWRPPGKVGYNTDIVGYPYSVQKAKALLTEAGYPSGFKTKLVYSSSTTNRALFTAVQNYLSAVGITAELEEADSARFRDLTGKGWQNHLVGIDMPCSVGMDPGRALNTRVSKYSTRYDPNSLGRSSEYDTLLDQMNIERDYDKRIAMIKELNKMIIDTYCIAYPIYVAGSARLSTFQVHDWTQDTFGGPQDWQPAKAWLSK